MTCQSYRITPLLFLSSPYLPFFSPFFCFFATELNAFKLKIAFLQLDEGLYVQHKKRSNSNANNNNKNCKTHSAARLLRVSLQYFFLLLFSLFVVFNKDLLLPKFWTTSRRRRKGRGGSKRMEREIRTHRHTKMLLLLAHIN